jgi:hypothetical protein
MAWLGGCGMPEAPAASTSAGLEVATAIPPMAPMSIQAQGMSLQGMSLQGMSLQGTQLQALSIQSVSLGGRSLQGATLVGARPSDSMTATLSDGSTTSILIDAIETDAADPTGEITLYTVLYRNPKTGAMENACPPDPSGAQRAVAVAGTWDARGNRVSSTTSFTFGCTSGVIAKCVRWGYKPWKTVSGKSLADYHQACTRMARADYCGDGTSHTFNGTWIDVYDGLGIQKKTPGMGGMFFEASWSVNGAICVGKPRWYGMALVREGTGLPPTTCEDHVDDLSLREAEAPRSAKEEAACDLKPQKGAVLVQNTSFINVVEP